MVLLFVNARLIAKCLGSFRKLLLKNEIKASIRAICFHKDSFKYNYFIHICMTDSPPPSSNIILISNFLLFDTIIEPAKNSLLTWTLSAPSFKVATRLMNSPFLKNTLAYRLKLDPVLELPSNMMEQGESLPMVQRSNLEKGKSAMSIPILIIFCFLDPNFAEWQ